MDVLFAVTPDGRIEELSALWQHESLKLSCFITQGELCILTKDPVFYISLWISSKHVGQLHWTSRTCVTVLIKSCRSQTAAAALK